MLSNHEVFLFDVLGWVNDFDLTLEAVYRYQAFGVLPDNNEIHGRVNINLTKLRKQFGYPLQTTHRFDRSNVSIEV